MQTINEEPEYDENKWINKDLNKWMKWQKAILQRVFKNVKKNNRCNISSGNINVSILYCKR